MSNEDWKKLEDWWGYDLFRSFDLQIDGYKVSLENQTYKMKISIAVYVDGYFKGIYMNLDNPIGKKFYPTRTKSLYSAKQMLEIIKIWGKREGKKRQSSYQYKDAYWKCFNSFKKHLKANCTDIKILEDE